MFLNIVKFFITFFFGHIHAVYSIYCFLGFLKYVFLNSEYFLRTFGHNVCNVFNEKDELATYELATIKIYLLKNNCHIFPIFPMLCNIFITAYKLNEKC